MSDTRSYIDGLAANGRYHFTLGEAQVVLGGTDAAVRLALGRLARQGLVAPRRMAFTSSYRLSISGSAACPPTSSFPLSWRASDLAIMPDSCPQLNIMGLPISDRRSLRL